MPWTMNYVPALTQDGSEIVVAASEDVAAAISGLEPESKLVALAAAFMEVARGIPTEPVAAFEEAVDFINSTLQRN